MTSGAKALEILPLYGTAEAVPDPNHSWLCSHLCYQSFLLIICTRHVVTRTASYGTAEAVPFQSVSRSAGYSDLPAYSQILLRLANTNLRTVIVTAAVHWGFSSKLRLAANLSL